MWRRLEEMIDNIDKNIDEDGFTASTIRRTRVFDDELGVI